MFEALLDDWRLTPDGAPIVTATGTLLPVIRDGAPAMLKRFSDDEEEAGAALLRWWGGDGAVRLLAQSGDTILMERATGPASPTAMALAGEDDRACHILCRTASRLHARRPAPLPDLVPLDARFAALRRTRHAALSHAAEIAGRLLADQSDLCPLHGDLHHGNVLDFGERGFLAIDPKGVFGERAFDFANIFCNPDLAHPEHRIARDPARFARRLAMVAQQARLDPERLRAWIIAWCGLSAAWFLEDDNPLAEIPLEIGAIARATGA
ncbi:aminoglycoside phosphotransferase family protein [Martelella soudanensis]|uniref:aminoglycoside phosphotransferase family protein n=1 Tax=unclassified Martelella TaxID=2629616 RepID=UPI0015E05B41|nr:MULTISPECIES: aminoglycoside phosphotransferase family protein [unclassified Martelella]